MKHILSLCAVLLLLPAVAAAQPLVAPFDFVMPSYDSTRSAWLPQLPADDIDARGYLRTSPAGHLEWADGSRARFVGVSVISSACFPDSADATATAARLRKLGVNMVRFDYFDHTNSNGSSVLAPGNRSDTLAPGQMKKLDWFLYQLKRNGIRAHFVLKARNTPRRDDTVPGWDSAYSYGNYISYFSEPMQRMQQRYMTALLSHPNPYTGKRYADDPVIALMTITDQNSLYDHWINDRLNQRASYMSFQHSRLLDSLYNAFLKRRYSTTAGLKAAYREGISGTGPNIVKNPGFESFTDNWNLQVGEGAQASPVLIQGTDVPPGEGAYTLRVAVRKVNGNESRIYLEQPGLRVRREGVYQVRFKARTDSAAGRQIRVVMMRGSSPNENFGLNETIDLTTSWKQFDFTFRSSGTDSVSTLLRFYMGKTGGDVFLDGVSVQETGREGLAAGEALENSTVARAKYRDIPKMSVRRMHDQVEFYDSLARAYYRTMSTHLRSLGVRALIAGTNNTVGAADSWVQSDFDFTSETAQWDYNGSRNSSVPYTDSTWVIRNYSILRYRDQKIPELARNAISGKPFIAEAYTHIFPNRYRSEMMLFLPSYASLHDWDGIYFYNYSDRAQEMKDRRRIFKDDFISIMADPSICALLPQVSAAMRGEWISPAERTIRIRHDAADLRNMPAVSRGTYGIEGSFNSVAGLVSAIRVDSFTASRHYTADDYYVTVPSDDNIESDTRQIKLDITKGVMQLNTPRVQGGSGALGNISMIRTDNLGVSWSDGGTHITYLWSTLDSFALDSARRSLLTVTTRALNTGAVWQYGDSSLGKNWGTAPVQMESARIGVNFYTAADTVLLHPLDSMAQPTGRIIPATRITSGSWRITLDLATEKTPWFGVEQRFAPSPDSNSSSAPPAAIAGISAGAIYPNPASGSAMLELMIPEGGRMVSGRICDLLGRTVSVIPGHYGVAGRVALPLELSLLPSGSYTCIITVGDATFAHPLVIRR